MKSLFCAVLLAAIIGVAGAQETANATDVGMAAGPVTGMGWSYRSWTDAWGYQLTAGYLAFADWGHGTSVGVNALYVLHDTAWTRLFAYGGTSVLGGANATSWGSASLTGAGLGMELVAFEHLAFDLQAGLMVSVPHRSPRDWYAGFTGELGVFYRL